MAFPAGGEEPARVLVLSSYHEDYTWTRDIVRGIRERLGEYGGPVELHFEFLDTKRYDPAPVYFDLLAGFYGYRYGLRPPSLIVASDNDAFNFLCRYRDKLFSDVPVVFCGVNDYSERLRARLPNSTGVAEIKEMGATLELALRLHPETRTVAVVWDDTTTSRIDRDLLVAACAKHSDLAVLDLCGRDLSLGDVLMQLREIENAVCVFISFWHDSSGKRYRLEDALPLICQASSAPVYTHGDTFVVDGVVGGVVTYGLKQGQIAGELGVRVLRGEKAGDIPVITTSSNVPMLNYPALARWGITLDMLPAGSEIINRPPPSFYVQYRTEIWGVVAAFFLLCALVVGLVANIVFRHRAERALRESEERYRSLVEEVPFPIIVHRDGRFVYANPTGLRLYGVSDLERLIGRRLDEFIHPEDRSRFEHRLERFRSGREPNSPHTGIRIIRGDGQVADIEATSIPVNYEGLPSFLAVCLDVTERKRSERERRRLETQVQQAQKLESLGVLAGGIAHDFNNLLMGVLGNADLALMDLPPDSMVRPRIRDIEKASRRAAELCQQMLAYSGKGRFEIAMLDISDLVSEMVHILRVSISKKADLQFDFRKPAPLVEADATQLRQVVMNLITNASDALGDSDGSIIVRVAGRQCLADDLRDAYLNEERPPGLYVCLEVIDNGCGMNEETRARLFDPFFTTKFTGRGLGLAAVLGIVRGHRGVIQVESSPGQGATFRILLPAVHAAGETPASLPGDVASSEEWSGAGTVLLVDDEETVLQVGRDMLERLGFRVITAHDGREALETFRVEQDNVVCVVLDLTMPHMDGTECFQELRRVRGDVPVILSSGYNEGSIAQQFANARGTGFVQKPYRTATLRDRIHALMDSGAAGS